MLGHATTAAGHPPDALAPGLLWGETDKRFDAWLAERRFGRHNRKLRHSSFIAYSGMFRRLTRYLHEEQVPLAQVDALHIEDFLKTRPLGPLAQRRHLLLFHAFFRAETRLDAPLVRTNPTVEMLKNAQPIGRPKPVPLRPAELRNLFQALSEAREGKAALDRLLFAAFLGCGLTVDELRSLRPEALPPRESLLRLPACGVRPPHAALILPAFKAWLTDATLLRSSHRNSAVLSAVSCFRRIRPWLKAYGADGHLGPERLRATYAVIVRSRYPDAQVQEWLGLHNERSLGHYPPDANWAAESFPWEAAGEAPGTPSAAHQEKPPLQNAGAV